MTEPFQEGKGMEFTDKTETDGNQKMRVGTRIIKQLSTTFYPHPLIIFDELVTNSRDALATKVRIHIERDKITIEDDGEGMTPEGLIHFFYISHSDKENKRVRSFRGVQRDIIGKFGIGKISLYQVCRKFKIDTWRDGTHSSASFDFGEFEKEEFIDAFTLNVHSEKVDRKASGTTITLMDLKEEALKQISVKNIKRRLIRTMPYSNDFTITISSPELHAPIILKPEMLEGRVNAEYPIDEAVDGVGKVTGRVLFFHSANVENHGVFISVFGRMINLDNAKGVINFYSLNHPHQFDNKIHVSINADGLNDALQSNRAGFVMTHPAYVAFRDWLFDKVNECVEKEYQRWKKLKKEIETKSIPSGVSAAFKSASYISTTPLAKRLTSSGPDRTKGRTHNPQRKRLDLMTLVKKGELKLDVKELGLMAPEAIFEEETKTLRINSSNPSYIFARMNGGIPGLVYHIFKASAILIALSSSKDLDEFKANYDEITRNTEILESLRELIKKK